MFGVRRRMSPATGFALLHLCYHASGFMDFIAPSESVCDDLIPPVRTRSRQETFNHFYQISQWENDDTLRIAILGSKRFRMKGFLIQVRTNNTVYGQFQPKQGALLVDCPPGKMNTIYYIQPNYTTHMFCQWTKPHDYDHNKTKSQLFVFTTAIKKLTKFWLSVEPVVPRYVTIVHPVIGSKLYDSDGCTSQPLVPGHLYFYTNEY